MENPVPRAGSKKRKKQECSDRIPIHLNIACTKCDGARCQLLQYRRPLNEVLRDIGLEICEDATCEDGIRIAIVEDNGRGYEFDVMQPSEITALNVVQFLLAEHGCITTVEVNLIMKHRESVIKALRLNRTVESVLISGTSPWFCQTDVDAFRAVKSMAQLKSLTLDTSRCPPYYAYVRPYGQLLRGATRQLRTLDVAAAEMSPKQAKQLIGALRRSKTVEHLVVGENVFTIGKQGSGSAFAEYLINTDTLRTLRLTSKPDFSNEDALWTLVMALCQARTLVEVKADLDLNMIGFAAKVSLFAQVVAENAILRRLRLPSLKCPCAHSWLNELFLDLRDPDSADKMVPWLAAVRKNTTLRELEIDLGGFGEPECREFFEAVADNDALHMVVIRHLPTDCPVDGICKTIREREIADRVLIKNHHVSPMDVSALPGCPEITSVTVNSRHFGSDFDQLHTAFTTLAGCPHVTSLSVHSWHFDDSLFESLINYMGESKTLEKIEVCVFPYFNEPTDEHILYLDKRLVEAAASIPSLVEVNFTGLGLYSNHYATFAGSVAAKRRRLTQVQITLAYHRNPAFANLLTPHEPEESEELAESAEESAESAAPTSTTEENPDYRSELAALQEIIARNRKYVSAAARYVLHERANNGRVTVIEDDRCASDGEVTVIEDNRRASDGGVKVIEDDRRASDGGVTVFEDDRHASDGGVKVIEDDRRASDGGVKVIEDDRRASEGGVTVFEDDRHASDGGVKVIEDGRRASDGGVTVFEDDRHSSDGGVKVIEDGRRASDGGVAVFEDDRRASDGGAKVIEDGRRASDGGAKVIEDGHRASDGGVTVFEDDRHTSDGGVKVIEDDRRASDDGVTVIEDDRHASDGGAKVIEYGRRASDGGAKVIEDGHRASDGGVKVIEDVHDHPWLVRKVRRLADIGVREVKEEIARSLRRVRMCDINEFMRLTGVVKECVESVEGDCPVGVQITDLNEYCWLHIRSFLKVSDVAGVCPFKA